MKNNQKLPEIALPADVCGLSGFTDEDTLELHVTEGALVFLKDSMTALEMAKAIESLNGLATELIVTLASACGICDNCGNVPELCERCGCSGDPAENVARCSLCMELLDESQITRISESILEELSIPKGTKLEAYTDEDSGEITDIQRDITDFPSDILEVLALSGICLVELDKLIMLEEIIYGE